MVHHSPILVASICAVLSVATPTFAADDSAPVTATAVTKYGLNVSGGSGSGSYAAGTVVKISAYAPAPGLVFDKWTGVTVAKPRSPDTTLVMPAAFVTVTA